MARRANRPPRPAVGGRGAAPQRTLRPLGTTGLATPPAPRRARRGAARGTGAPGPGAAHGDAHHRRAARARERPRRPGAHSARLRARRSLGAAGGGPRGRRARGTRDAATQPRRRPRAPIGARRRARAGAGLPGGRRAGWAPRATARPPPRRDGRGRRRRRGARPGGRARGAHPARLRDRARHRLPAAADGGAGAARGSAGRAPEPARDSGRLRRRQADLPGRRRRGLARLRVAGLRRRLGACVLLLPDLRAGDGLHRVPAGDGARAARADRGCPCRARGGTGPLRPRNQRRRRGDGGGLLHVRPIGPSSSQGDGSHPRRGRAARHAAGAAVAAAGRAAAPRWTRLVGSLDGRPPGAHHPLRHIEPEGSPPVLPERS